MGKRILHCIYTSGYGSFNYIVNLQTLGWRVMKQHQQQKEKQKINNSMKVNNLLLMTNVSIKKREDNQTASWSKNCFCLTYEPGRKFIRKKKTFYEGMKITTKISKPMWQQKLYWKGYWSHILHAGCITSERTYAISPFGIDLFQ